MASALRRSKKKNQVCRRQHNRNRCKGKSRGGKTHGRYLKRGHGKKHLAKRPLRRPQKLRPDSVRMTNEAQNILHFCVHDLYKKVSLAAERLRKKKRHVSITVSDVRNALKKIMPGKYDRKTAPYISCKCH